MSAVFDEDKTESMSKKQKHCMDIRNINEIILELKERDEYFKREMVESERRDQERINSNSETSGRNDKILLVLFLIISILFLIK